MSTFRSFFIKSMAAKENNAQGEAIKTIPHAPNLLFIITFQNCWLLLLTYYNALIMAVKAHMSHKSHPTILRCANYFMTLITLKVSPPREVSTNNWILTHIHFYMLVNREVVILSIFIKHILFPSCRISERLVHLERKIQTLQIYRDKRLIMSQY